HDGRRHEKSCRIEWGVHQSFRMTDCLSQRTRKWELTVDDRRWSATAGESYGRDKSQGEPCRFHVISLEVNRRRAWRCLATVKAPSRPRERLPPASPMLVQGICRVATNGTATRNASGALGRAHVEGPRIELSALTDSDGYGIEAADQG